MFIPCFIPWFIPWVHHHWVYLHWGVYPLLWGRRESTPNSRKEHSLKRWGGLGSWNRDYWFFYFFFAFLRFFVFAWHRILGTPYYDLIIFHFFFRCSLCTFCCIRSKIFFVKFHFRCFWIFEFCWKRNLQWRTLRFLQFCRAWFWDFVAIEGGICPASSSVATWAWAMLCYAIRCCEMLCYAMPFDATRCYAKLCYAMLRYKMIRFAMLRYALLCYAMLCYVMLCHAMVCYAMLC